MKRNNVLFMIAVVIIMLVTSWTLIKYSKEGGGEGGVITKVSDTEMMIEERALSNHKADYYEDVYDDGENDDD